MLKSVFRKPDGSFHCGDHDYRLEQHEDRFDVVREDGEHVGAFVLQQSTAEVEAGALEPAVVSAIAKLLSNPRGLLPLQ
jgi:hypothetical protein